MNLLNKSTDKFERDWSVRVDYDNDTAMALFAGHVHWAVPVEMRSYVQGLITAGNLVVDNLNNMLNRYGKDASVYPEQWADLNAFGTTAIDENGLTVINVLECKCQTTENEIIITLSAKPASGE